MASWRIEGADEGSPTGWSSDAIVGSASERDNVFPSAAAARCAARDVFGDEVSEGDDWRVVEIDMTDPRD
jgi:hypothetical protein